MVKVGDKILLTNTDYPEYPKLKDKKLTVIDVAYDNKGHYLYDEGVNAEGEHMPLVTCKEIDFCLYEYEFVVVEKSK